MKFKAPTTLFDGSAATGAITYSVLANGEAVGSGNTTFGAEVSVPVTLAQPDSMTSLSLLPMLPAPARRQNSPLS